MKVVRAKTAGFCMGVSLALRQLDAALESQQEQEHPARLATLGPVIHNPRVIAAYEARGIVCMESPNDAREGDTVLIRAHGVPREIENALQTKGVRVVDATCPRVKQAQLAIAREKEKGRTLLLYGEADHPEVEGLVSYAGNDAYVFLNLAELEAIPLDMDRNYFLAAQTTQDMNGFTPICERVKERLGHEVPVLHTICDATQKRQAEVLHLAEAADIVVVVGGSNSGNTRRLAEVAEGKGIKSLRVEDVSELSPALFAGAEVVGLTAGASTPAEHIDAVESWLNKQ